MLSNSSRMIRTHAVAMLLIMGAVSVAPRVLSAPQNIPERLTDEAFWRMVSEFSEMGGYFRSDNFVSNETTFQYVIPELVTLGGSGGVYLGVGPDQNFTYIVALRPRISFVVDIRRQNMLQHLLYKALMEESPTRAEFLSRLFSRPRPAGIDTVSAAAGLFQAYAGITPDSASFVRNLATVRDRLVKTHGFTLSAEDLAAIEYVHSAFYFAGPELNYSYSARGRGGFGGRRMPSYAELMVADDGQGNHRSYLASEENYRVLRDLQMRNLIVPLVGDFAGEKAIKAVGKYVADHGATITAFYTSNVEQYLFQQGDDWRRFFTNVGALPLNEKSTFIRAVFNNMAFRDPVAVTTGPRSVTMLGSIADQVKAFNDGRIQMYLDVIQMSR
jgi:hypothetical protein